MLNIISNFPDGLSSNQRGQIAIRHIGLVNIAFGNDAKTQIGNDAFHKMHLGGKKMCPAAYAFTSPSPSTSASSPSSALVTCSFSNKKKS
jgi:hypothetical protein